MHFHVLGHSRDFPMRRTASTRRRMPHSMHTCACVTCCIERGFVVHANTHGFDNSVDLDAVAQSAGRYLAG